MTISDVASIILALTTLGSLVYISRQVNVARQQAKGQFLLALDEQFTRANDITLRLANEEGFKPAGPDWPQIWALMSVFERINIMLDDKILDIALVDRLYAFRLIFVINNDEVYNRISSTGAEWQDFIDLCHKVADFRARGRCDVRDNTFIQRVSTLNKSANRIQNPWRF